MRETGVRMIYGYPTSTSREAICSCGWIGPNRGTAELAWDDANEHILVEVYNKDCKSHAT